MAQCVGLAAVGAAAPSKRKEHQNLAPERAVGPSVKGHGRQGGREPERHSSTSRSFLPHSPASGPHWVIPIAGWRARGNWCDPGHKAGQRKVENGCRGGWRGKNREMWPTPSPFSPQPGFFPWIPLCLMVFFKLTPLKIILITFKCTIQ